jgi:AraC family transcriptional regulator, melibiose operon regulatory protein
MPRLEVFGLRVWHGAVMRMHAPHQHTEIELNLVETGGITYRFGARDLRLAAGEWMLFWGALPHHLTDTDPDTTLIWVTLPLSSFLRFGLPEAFSRRILHGHPGVARGASDLELFQRWTQDWLEPHGDTSRILELELEARLRRLARDLEWLAPPNRSEFNPDRAARLAGFIAEHHLEPLTMERVARAAGLHPHYAADLFKRSFGMTMLEYLTQHRVAHAQRLLATTDRSVLDIALESGFGSSSRFYVVFERATGRAPLEYRRAVRAG